AQGRLLRVRGDDVEGEAADLAGRGLRLDGGGARRRHPRRRVVERALAVERIARAEEGGAREPGLHAGVADLDHHRRARAGRQRRGRAGRDQLGVPRRRAAAGAGLEAVGRRAGQTGGGLRPVQAVLVDEILGVVAVPQPLEGEDVVAAQVGRGEVIEVNLVARHRLLPAVLAERAAPLAVVADVQRAAALVVGGAGGGGRGDAAAAALVPGAQEVLLGDRAERAVDAQLAAA